MAYYARKCDADGSDQCGGDNCLWLDGRHSVTTMHYIAAEWARKAGAPGYNLYRTLRDSRPLKTTLFKKAGE